MSIANIDNLHQATRDRLLADRARITGQMRFVAQDELEFELETDGVPPSGQQRTEALSLIFSRELSDIERALDRLDEGTYGICAGCSNAIPARRLEVQPFAIFCVDCQVKADRRARRRP